VVREPLESWIVARGVSGVAVDVEGHMFDGGQRCY
jgi:hypothetical protein